MTTRFRYVPVDDWLEYLTMINAIDSYQEYAELISAMCIDEICHHLAEQKYGDSVYPTELSRWAESYVSRRQS